MQNNHFSPLKHLDCLHQIFPVKGAIVVGAGMGESLWFDLLQQIETNVLLLEANSERIQYLNHKFSESVSWNIQYQVVASQEGESVFYNLANSSESSLLEPEILRDLWPNVKLESKYNRETIKLDGLHLETDFNWLILDCLPALPLLQGAETVLACMDVVVIRLITDNQFCPETHTSFKDIEEFMRENGFQCIGLEQEIHPALGHGIYLRDYARLLQQQTKHNAVQTTKLDAQTKELEQQRTLVKEREQLIQELTKNKEAQAKELQHSQQQLVEQRRQSEEQRVLAQKRKERLEQWTKERDAKSSESEELKKRTQELCQERDKLASQIKNHSKELSELKRNSSSSNPYSHNRILTQELNIDLKQFAHKTLNMTGIKPTYIDYLATKAIQIEKNCVGRLATTVQDAVARQLILECVPSQKICILEIGALYGVSLSILYNHMVTRSKKVKIVCLDPFDGYYGEANDALLNSPVNKSAFIRNMQISNVPKDDYQIIKHYSTSPKAIEIAKKLAINCIIIDGDHSYEGIKFDFENYLPLLEVGGYVIFDDYNAKEWPGVQKFIDEDLLKFSDFDFLGAISRTAVGRKKANKDL